MSRITTVSKPMNRAVHFFTTSRLTGPALLILICAVAAGGWWNSGLPKGHDALATVCGAASVKDFFMSYGSLWHWSSYGTVSSLFLDSRVLYCVLLIINLLFAWGVAAKILFFTLFALSAISMYFYAHELTGSRPASFVAGLAYVLAPYHLIEVVFEGHWSIGAQYMLTPLVFLAVEKALQQPKMGRIILAGLSLASLIALGHAQTLPILVGPFLALYMVFRVWKSGRERAGLRALTCLSIFLIGLSLTAFWWLPLLREINYFQAPYTLASSESYKATFLQALTLRPSLCCATSSAYGASASGIATVLSFLPFLLAAFGIVLNRKNKYVWFFSALIVITWLLAMGSSSPVPLFTFAERYFPLFSGLRTPVRFLLLTSFSYAILMGFCLKGIGDRLGRVHLRQFKRSNVLLAVLVLTSFIVVANTWSEARTALSTFTLSSDQEGALSYLAEQENGDYRIADSSFENEAQNPDSRYIVNPIYWTFAHGKETMPGGMPESNRYTTNLIESLRTDLAKSPLDMSEWLSLLNLKYIVVDKTNPLSSNTILGPDFERVWTSNTIDIYENHAVKPRVCSVSNTNERIIALSSAGTVNLEYAEGTQDAIVSISDEHRLSDEPTVKSVYHFTTPDDYLCLETKVDGITFDQNDAIRLVFYSEYDMPDVHLTLDVLERDGSKYDVVLGGVDGIKSGWNEVNFPISLLTLRYSTDENGHLDPGEIDRLCIGVGKQGDANEPRDFTLYFDRLSIVTQETNANVQFTKIRPGKYEVYVDSDVPSTLVLSESYNPNWVAKYDGKEVHSELVCQALNSFSIEAGKHEVTLEFVSSPLRKAGNVISVVSLGVLCAAGILVLLKRRRKRMQAATVSTEDASDGGHPR